MGTIVKYGIILGVLVVAWTFVMGYTGWYRDPTLLNLFWVVVLIEIFVLLTALRVTARKGYGYGAQLGVGFAVSTLAGLIIFAGSYIFTTAAFPNYFDELRVLQESMMREAGVAEHEITAQLEAAKRQYTPFNQALQGFIGTVMTGLIVTAFAAIWVRHKGRAEPQPTAA